MIGSSRRIGSIAALTWSQCLATSSEMTRKCQRGFALILSTLH